MTNLDVLVQCAWKGSVLLGAGFAANAVLRRRSPALRHSMWTVCFAAALLLPIGVLSLPRWGVLGRPDAQPVPAVATAEVQVVVSGRAPLPAAPAPVNVPLLVWAAGAGVTALWFLLGILRTSWMVRRAAQAGSASDIARSLGIGRRVRLLSTSAAPMPLTWGILRPVVVLPAASAQWPEARRHTVLLHELVHVKRLDLLAQAIGQAACCLYWFHPLAWIAAARLRREREQACDDAVLACGIPAPEYAGHLMDLVRAMSARRNKWAQAPAMAEASGLESRVRAMLDPKRDRRPLNGWRALAIVSAGATLLLPLAALSETHAVALPQRTSAPIPEATPAPAVTAPVHRHPKLLAMATVAEPAPPQVARGSIAGTVKDPSGGVIPGCTVVVHNADGSNQETATANSAGQYNLNSIPAGTYSLEVRAPGFVLFKRSAVQVAAGNVVQVNANMELGAMSEVITVQGKRPATVTPSTAAPQRIAVGGNVQAARLVRQPRPVYPPELQQLGIEGTVTLKAIISKEGIPMSIRAVGSSVDERLVKYAIDAVSQWRYTPMLLNGMPVETVTTIDIAFTLEQ